MNRLNILQKAFESRNYLFEHTESDCFRLFNSDGDGIFGLTIDIYGEYLLIQFFEDSLYDIQDMLLKDIVNAAGKIPAKIKGFIFKDRIKAGDITDPQEQRKSLVFEGSFPENDYTVYQNGIKASVDLIRGQSTGVFLDMREVRDRLKSFYAENGRILNLFCYTALFSVHALKNGFRSSTNVDLSKQVLRKARKNYCLNDIKLDDRDFICGDAISWMKTLKNRGSEYELIIFDPPTFSRNKKRTFSVKKNFKSALLRLNELSGQGMVLTSINSHSVSKKEYFSYHPEEWDLLFYNNESSDFPATGEPYLKVGLWKRRKK